MAKQCSHYNTGSEPRCAHDECWFIYFSQYPRTVLAIGEAVKRFGWEKVEREYGQKYLKRIVRFHEGRMKGGRKISN